MKLLVKTNTVAGKEQRDLNNEGYSIPNPAITLISIIYLVLNIAATSLSNLISSYPQTTANNKTFELKKQNFELQLLQRVLESTSDSDRKLSLQLILKAGLLNDDKGNLWQFVTAQPHIPQWRQKNLESLNSYLGSQGPVYNPLTNNSIGGSTGTIQTPPGNPDTPGPVNTGGSIPRSNDNVQKKPGVQ